MNKFVSAVLSFLIPGLGQFYNKENKKAVLFFVAGLISMLHGLLFFIFRIYAAYEAYDVANKIEKGEIKPEKVPETTGAKESKPVEDKPVEPENTEEPISAPVESKQDVLLRALLDITTEDRYYQFDEIRKGMEARYGTAQTWLTNAWVGRKLGPLGFTDKRRVAAGTEVKLTASEVLNLARKKGLF